MTSQFVAHLKLSHTWRTKIKGNTSKIHLYFVIFSKRRLLMILKNPNKISKE